MYVFAWLGTCLVPGEYGFVNMYVLVATAVVDAVTEPNDTVSW
jgi:hypothetical protein